MKASKLVIPMLVAGSLLARNDRDRKTGTVNLVEVVPYRVPGVNLGEGRGYPTPQIMQWLRIQGYDAIFNVSYVVSWYTPKVTIGGPIKYALGTDGKFYIRDADNREFKVKVVDRDPVPPAAGKDHDWKTGRVNFVANLPFMNGGSVYANMPGVPPRVRQWLQIEGDTYIFNLNYVPSWHPPNVTLNGPVKYAVDTALDSDGKFYVQDSDGLEFEVNFVNKELLPPLADSSEASTEPPFVSPNASAPATLYDRDGVEVVAVETDKTIDFTVGAPENVYVSILADRDQNGQIDHLVDTSYGLLHGEPRLCTLYLIDERTSTLCGGLQSAARLSNFTVDQGRRKYVLSIPKGELSAGLDSASFVLRFWNSATNAWTSYPSPSFQRALHWQYTVHHGQGGDASPFLLPLNPPAAPPGLKPSYRR